MFHTNSTHENYAVCCVPVSPLRLEPSHKSEMVSQQLFGESCKVIEEETGHWIKVECRYDGYQGWCQDSHVVAIEESQYESTINVLTADWINQIDFTGKKMMVPMGCSLPGLKKGITAWKSQTVEFRGRLIDPGTVSPDEATINQIARQFLNTSYLWGGKSVFGVDCSGFTQTVYKFLNISLLRDASQQALQGNAIGFLQEARCGDLAFFDNSDGKIIHVGIMLNDHEIIHSSGKVRIDKIDSQGIVNQNNFERTHQLRIIKRYF